jgi:hypothetical protein
MSPITMIPQPRATCQCLPSQIFVMNCQSQSSRPTRVPRPASQTTGHSFITDTSVSLKLSSSHALGTEAFPGIRPATLLNLQLLQEASQLRQSAFTFHIRIFPRTSAATLRPLRVCLCRNAGACPHACQRTGPGYAGANHAVVETVRRTDIGIASSGSVLASAVLRFQCVERAQVHREGPLHSPESGDPRLGRASRRLAMEQFPSLCKR